jgi:hypothetical protein
MNIMIVMIIVTIDNILNKNSKIINISLELHFYTLYILLKPCTEFNVGLSCNSPPRARYTSPDT